MDISDDYCINLLFSILIADACDIIGGKKPYAPAFLIKISIML